MLYNLNPMDIRLAFVRRLFLIDDTVLATVTLVPNCSVKIRRAYLNLVAQARLTEVKKGRSMGLGIYPTATSSFHVHHGRGTSSARAFPSGSIKIAPPNTTPPTTATKATCPPATAAIGIDKARQPAM
jgi:hypothetical protein